MNIGMLWFDNDPKAGLDRKVQRAADYYRNKYGRTPTLCFVHPSMLPAPVPSPKNGRSTLNDDSDTPHVEDRNYVTGGVEVRSHRSVLPNHFWIGVNGSSEARPGKW